MDGGPSDELIAAITEVVCVVCAADHSLSREERGRIRERIERATETSLDPQRFERCFVAAALALDSSEPVSSLSRLREGALAGDATRRLALDVANEVMRADGLEGGERDRLLEACDALGVARAEFEERLREAGAYRAQ